MFLQRLELLVVAPMLRAEAPEFLVLGHESFDEGLLIHRVTSIGWGHT